MTELLDQQAQYASTEDVLFEYDSEPLTHDGTTQEPQETERPEPVPIRPASIEENKRRIRKRDLALVAFEPTAYEALGGGIRQSTELDIPEPRPIDDVIRGSEPWQTDIIDAVERFAMNELTLEKFEAMKRERKELQFVLHFDSFYRSVLRRHNILKLANRSPELDRELINFYGSDVSQAALAAYSDRLGDLLEAMNATGIPKAVKASLGPRRLKASKAVKYWDYQYTSK